MKTSCTISVIVLLFLCHSPIRAGNPGTDSKPDPGYAADSNPPKLAYISANSGSPLCGPSQVEYYVYMEGCNGPYTINLWINGLLVIVNANASPYTFTLNVNSSMTVVLGSVTSPGCNFTIVMPNIITIVVSPPLLATLTGTTSICQGGSGTDLKIAFNGNGPYTFVYKVNNSFQAPITTSSNPYYIHVNPATTTTYTLISVNNPNCSGNVSLLNVIVTVVSPPAATMSGDMTFCGRADTSLMVNLSGTGPYTITYAIDSVAQPPEQTAVSPYHLPVHIDSTSVFTLWNVSNGVCNGQAAGQATITILSTPSDTNRVIRCHPEDNTYTVEFDVVDASGSIQFVSGTGSLSGNHFISAPIHQDSAYSFVFHDSLHCENVIVAGPSSCFCVSFADTMVLKDTLSTCIGDTIFAPYAGLPALDGDDSLRFALHTAPGDSLGRIIAWNDEPQFGFLNGMFPDTIYYISAVAGDYAGSDSIDVVDICLSVAPGTPVLFHALPEAMFGPDLRLCAGADTLAPVTLSGAAPFTFSYSIDGLPQSPVQGITGSSFGLSLTPPDTALIEIWSVSDKFCTNTTRDSLLITVNFIPEITNLAVTCDPYTTTYSVAFDITGGESPWTVTGSGGGLAGTVFTSDNIPSGQTYAFSLSDVNHCGTSDVTETYTCPCATQSGTLGITPLELCPGETAMAAHGADQWLDHNDVLHFVLHTGNPAAPGSVLKESDVPVFDFDPASMQYGITYFISAVAGDSLATGLLDYSAACLSVSDPLPVIWHAAPEASLSGAFDICPGMAQMVELTLTGQVPFTFNYTENGTPYSFVTGINPIGWIIFPDQNTQILPVSIHDAHCPGMVSGQTDITVHPAPAFSSTVLQFCDPDNLHYSVGLSVNGGDPGSTIVQSFPSGGSFDPASGIFLGASTNLPAPSMFVVSDGWQCGQDTLVFTPLCACTTYAGMLADTTLNLCPGELAVVPHDGGQTLDPNDVLLYVLHSGSSANPGSILAVSGQPQFSFDPAVMQLETTYYVSAVAGNANAAGGLNWSDPCLSQTNSVPLTWHKSPAAVLSGDADICAGDLHSVNVAFSGNAPFVFEYEENGSLQTIHSTLDQLSIQTQGSQTTTFSAVTVSDAFCPGVASGSAEVRVHDIPSIANPHLSCHPDNLHFSVDFEITGGDPATMLVQPAGAGLFNPVTGVFTGSGTDLPGPLLLTVSDGWQCGTDSLVAIPDCSCVTDAGILQPGNLDLCAGQDIVLNPASGQVLDGFDTSVYLLCTDPSLLPAGIVSVSAVPQFPASLNLSAGVTYFMVAVAGNPQPGGGPDFNDPCLSLSNPVTVKIHVLPTAQMHADTALCSGSDYEIPVSFSGTPPFEFVYSVNSVPEPVVNTTQFNHSIPVSGITETLQFGLVSIQDQFCSGTVDGSALLTVIPRPSVLLSGNDSICPGGSASLHIDLQNAGMVNFDLMSNNSASQHITGAVNGTTIVVSPQQSTIYSIGNVQASDNVCGPLFGGTAKVDLAPITLTVESGDYHGFGVSCFGAEDGFATAVLSGGFNPVSLLWSGQQTGASIEDLAPGHYQVTATDVEGCTHTAGVDLTEPEPLETAWSVSDITCFPGSTGIVTIDGIAQGAGSYQVQINGNAPFSATDFPVEVDGLSDGPVLLQISDANGCLLTQTDTIDAPVPLTLKLGQDTILTYGDTLRIEAVTGGNPPVSWTWSPVEGLLDPESLHPLASPLESTLYVLVITDDAGCTATDDILVKLSKSRRLYIPNVIKPGASNDNGVFTVYAGPELRNIRYMAIYDRWGEHLFQADGAQPNDPATGWDGTWKGQPVLPGVYVYVMELEFRDGAIELYKGSITVVR